MRRDIASILVLILVVLLLLSLVIFSYSIIKTNGLEKNKESNIGIVESEYDLPQAIIPEKKEIFPR